MKKMIIVAFFLASSSFCACRDYCDYDCELKKYILPSIESCKWTLGRHRSEIEQKFGIYLDVDYSVSKDGAFQSYVDLRPMECYRTSDGTLLYRCGDGGLRDSSGEDLSPFDAGKCVGGQVWYCENCRNPDVCYKVRLWFLDVPQGTYFDCRMADCFYDTEPQETCKLVRGCAMLFDVQTDRVSAIDMCVLCVPTRYAPDVPIERPVAGRYRDIDC